MKRVNWLGNVALGLLLVLDLALVGLVFTHARSGSTGGATAVVTPTDSTSSPTSTATTTTAAKPTLAAGLLSVPDAKTAWSATKGSCSKGGAQVSRTSNAGGTWTGTKEQPYAALTRLDATTGQTAFVVGAGSSCALAIRSTSVGGDTWRSPTTVSTSWALDIADATKVHSTAGTTTTPCGGVKVTAFARVSDSSASVLCADGSTRTTTDAAATWTKGPSLASVSGLGPVVGLVAAGSGDSARLVAAASSADCAGVKIVVSSAGKAFAPAACVTPLATGPTLPVALAQQLDRAGTVWLLAGTDLWHASGPLTAWSKAT